MKSILTIASLALALGISSCSYLECLMAPNPKECAAGKAIESAIEYLAGANGVDSQQKADEFASTWSKVQSAISVAQGLKIDIPEGAKKGYNETITRMAKHNYFGSTTLRNAMQGAEYIR